MFKNVDCSNELTKTVIQRPLVGRPQTFSCFSESFPTADAVLKIGFKDRKYANSQYNTLHGDHLQGLYHMRFTTYLKSIN